MPDIVRKRWFLVVVGAVLALILVLVGIRFLAYPAFVGAPDHVHVVVTRIESPLGAHTVIFDQQSDAVARQVYAQLVSGVSIPPNAHQECGPGPLRPWYHYDLTFSHLGIQTGVASSDARDCKDIGLDPLGGVLVGGTEIFLSQAPDGTSFWDVLNQLIGAPLPI